MKAILCIALAALVFSLAACARNPAKLVKIREVQPGQTVIVFGVEPSPDAASGVSIRRYDRKRERMVASCLGTFPRIDFTAPAGAAPPYYRAYRVPAGDWTAYWARTREGFVVPPRRVTYLGDFSTSGAVLRTPEQLDQLKARIPSLPAPAYGETFWSKPSGTMMICMP